MSSLLRKQVRGPRGFDRGRHLPAHWSLWPIETKRGARNHRHWRRYIILRPPLIYGEGVKGNMRSLITLARLPLPLPFGAVDNRRSLLAIENPVAMICLLIERDDIDKQVLLVADATPVSLPQIISCLRRGMGKPRNLLAVSPTLLEMVFRLLRRSNQWQRLGGNLVISIERSKSFGYAPVVSTLDALTAMTSTARSHEGL